MIDRRRHPILDLFASPEGQAHLRAAAEERLAEARRTGIPIVHHDRMRGEIVYDFGDERIVPVTLEADTKVERLMRSRRTSSGGGSDD